MSKIHNTLKALRHVAVLARTLNYTRAAQELHISQSALTRSIQATEQDNKLRIFDRDRGGVHLTTAGQAFVDKAVALLREADDFERQVALLAGGEDYEIAFGMAPLPARALLPELATEAFIASSRLRWQVEINSAADLLRRLLNEDIEFFLCAEEQLSAHAPVRAVPLGKFPLSFVVRKDHPLLTTPASGQTFPVVSVAAIPSYSGFPKPVRSVLEFPPRLVANDYALLASITAQSNAIWPTPAFTVLDELKSGSLTVLPIGSKRSVAQFSIVTYSLQKRSLSPGALRLQRRFQYRMQELGKSVVALTGA